MVNMDDEALHLLDGMREARDAANRKRQRLLDEAAHLRIVADAKESTADHMLKELNEGVPFGEDR